MNLKGFQRSYLSKEAHHLHPVVTIGKAGMTSEVKKAVDAALYAHELIKVKFQDYKEGRKDISHDLAKQCNAIVVRIIGNIVILYKEHPDKEKQKYTIPGR